MRTWLTKNAVWLGAVAGAVMLPVLQIVETFVALRYVVPHDKGRIVLSVLAIVIKYRWLLWLIKGAILGAYSGATFASRLRRDATRLQRFARQAVVLVVLSSAWPLHEVWASIRALSAKGTLPTWSGKTGTATILSDVALQWAIALALYTYTVAKRLEHEQDFATD